MPLPAAPLNISNRIHPGAGYQILLVCLLSVNFGIVFFDRNALSFLMSFIQSDLRLSNAEVGALAGGLSFTWAIAGLAVGHLSDKTGYRKSVILVATLMFSLCSLVTGLASSFAMLLGARLIMGIAEGGVLPVSQSLVAHEVVRERRGLAMGVMQNVGSNLLGWSRRSYFACRGRRGIRVARRDVLCMHSGHNQRGSYLAVCRRANSRTDASH